MNVYVAPRQSSELHRLVQAFEVAGLEVSEVLLGAARRLAANGDLAALQIVQTALGCADEIELRALLYQRSRIQRGS